MRWLRRLLISGHDQRVDAAWNEWLDEMQAGLRADREVVLTEDNWRDPPWPSIKPWVPPR